MKSFSIRLLYLYLFSFVGLLITVIGVIRLVDLGMKVYVFKGADEYYYSSPVQLKDPSISKMTPEEEKQYQVNEEKRQQEENRRNRQREFSSAVSMIVVGIPLYLYHWKMIQKENNSFIYDRIPADGRIKN